MWYPGTAMHTYEEHAIQTSRANPSDNENILSKSKFTYATEVAITITSNFPLTLPVSSFGDEHRALSF